MTDGGEGISGNIRSEETKRKLSKINKGENHPQYGKRGKRSNVYGKKWWNDGCGNNKRSIECPGPNWVLGMSEECKTKLSKNTRGKRRWNDGCGNSRFSIDCPGEGWVLGLSEKHKRNCSISKKGIKWWNDGKGNRKMSIECPGEGWFPGSGKR